MEFLRSLTVHQGPIESIGLHSFGDASRNGVAACVYAVVHQVSGCNQGLVTARKRLAKPELTIPRLELVAAHIAVNLAANVREALSGFPLKKVLCWSDSSVALYWIKGTGSYKQFVVNRVKKIRSHQDVNWRYVPTASNPVDLGSRGGKVNNTEMWWSGPEWLAKTENWPPDIVTEPSTESKAEAKPFREVVSIAVREVNEIDHVLEKFTLHKALRICSWIRRFAHNSLHRNRRTECIKGPLTTVETKKQLFWIKQAQQNCDIESDCVALNLQPGAAGILECRGRIEGEYPIYLPDTHIFSRRVVEEAHLLTLHGGIGITMAKFRSKYWIPRLRRLVRKVCKNCYGCKRLTTSA